MRVDPKTGLTDIENLSYNTVRLDIEYDKGKFGLGTGFLYQFKTANEDIIPTLITNKHVLKNAKKLNLLFHPTGNDGKIDLQSNKISVCVNLDRWYGHPDPNIDLAFVSLTNIITHLNNNEKQIPYMLYCTREHFPKPEEWNNLTALEQVVIVGYPAGIWDEVNNLPIIKRGVTSTHPKINYQGKPEFLVDASVYIGSSGSPVFLYENKDMFLGQDLNMGKDRPRLVGILSEIFYQEQAGDMKSVAIPTTKRKMIPFTKIPNNLGVVIKSTELDGFITLIDKELEITKPSQLKKD